MTFNLPFLATFESGTVWLVGAGPGDPGLLSLHGLHALQHCDCLVYDALVNPQLLDLVNPNATLVFAGKRGGRPSVKQKDICERLVSEAKSGARVLRLKGGDPFTFGRGGEEIRALYNANIDFRIVPGITAAASLPYAGIPLTDRQCNSVVSFVTGHGSGGGLPSEVDWKGLARGSPVLVFYMALRHIAHIVQQLLDAGRNSNEPSAIIENISLPHQQTIFCSLGKITEEAAHIKGPAIIVVGKVVNLHKMMMWFDVESR